MVTMRFARLPLLLISAWLLAMPTAAAARPVLTVFAAASLTNALQEVADAYREQSGGEVRLSFAASSTLAKQIEAGALADLFVSADEVWMDYLQRRGLLAPGSRRPLVKNTLVLVVPSSRPMTLELAPGGAWLDRLPKGRIATGDPAHVPAGIYARQALTSLGVWSAVEPRLARADNVRNALVLVEREEAVAGIVYGTDAAISRRVSVAGTFPPSSHEPISYPVAITAGGQREEAEKLAAFLAGPKAAAIFERNGFAMR